MRYFTTRLLGGLLLALLLAPGMALSQTAKISGEVVDADTGEPLPGANVRVEGTTLGAATNSDGEYTIPQVAPGTYTVRVTFVGYQSVRRTNVEIVSEITKRLDFELQEAEFEGQEVVVRAEEPLVKTTSTSAVRRLGREEFENLPTRSAETYYAIQPGVTLQNGEIHVRGGRSSETDFLLDGVSSRSLLGTDNVIPVIPEALQETQVFAGGYSADKGGANAGIVQQTLRTGGSELGASFQYEGDQLASSFNDTYSYGDQDITGTIGGPLYWDEVRFFVAANYTETDNYDPVFWEGANLNYGSDGGLCADVSQEGCTPPIDATDGDTATAPLSWGDGELPGLRRPQEELTLNGTLQFNFDPLRLKATFAQINRERRINDTPIFSVYNSARIAKREDTRRLVSIQPTYFLSDNTYLEGKFGLFQYNFESYDPLVGKPSAGQGGLLPDLLKYQDRRAIAHARGIDTTGASQLSDAELNELMSQDRYTRSWNGRYQDPSVYNFTTFRFERPGQLNRQYVKREQSYWTTSLNLVSQQGSHEINFGGEYKKWTVRQYGFFNPAAIASNVRTDETFRDAIAQEDSTVAFTIRNNGTNYYGYDEFGNEVDSGPDGAKEPVTAAAWINDRIEFEDIIVNAGLRLNYFDMDLWEAADPENPPYDLDNRQVLVGENKDLNGDGEIGPGETGLKEADGDFNLLPRLGLSFPVSDRTVFYLQYGKFSQMPDLGNAYSGRGRIGEILRARFFFSDPFAYDLDPITTTQYEVGFSRQFSDFAAFDLTAYYRRTENQLEITQFETGSETEAGPTYNVFQNGDFSITRGFETSIRTKRIGGFLAQLNYTLSDAKGTNTDPSGQVSALENNEPTPAQIQPLEFMQRHQGSFVLDYRSGSDQPIWGRNWSVNLLGQFTSGRHFTRSTGGIGQRGADEGALLPDTDPRNRNPLEPLNQSTTPFRASFDLRLERGVNLGPAEATVYMYVQNIFNQKSAKNVYLRTGNAEDDGFLNNPDLSSEIVAAQGQRYVDMYRSINLDNRAHYRSDFGQDLFVEPRQVRLGVQVNY